MNTDSVIQRTGVSASPSTCQILTFYSYKGGTGRSMAVANVSWILASQGKRVLVIDWDLEAPGLHRYFAPFLDDPELAETSGLIDFFAAFVEGSRHQAFKTASAPPVVSEEEKGGEAGPEADGGPRWFDEYADLLDYAVSLDYEFPGEGTLDFVPAGRQGPSYGALVATFQWNDFYEKLGGGVFLESVKRRLRESYDYIIIDSRTGLSDTSGICTVQMPDDLVVFFTLNLQSMRGAAATAESALRSRQRPSGEPGLRVWPVPSRIDLTEKDRLETVRQMARESFSRCLWHLTREERNEYWVRSEILYIPYYAYLETLAVAADRSGQTASLLGCMEQLTAWISRGVVKCLAPLDSLQRMRLLERFTGTLDGWSLKPKTTGACIFLSYAKGDFQDPALAPVFKRLRTSLPECRLFWDEDTLLGSDITSLLASELAQADILVVFFGQGAISSRGVAHEVKSAIADGKIIVPVLLADQIAWWDLPTELSSFRGVDLKAADLDEGIAKLATGLKQVAMRVRPKVVDPEDPQKGRWGTQSRRDGYEIQAHVKEITPEWFGVELFVRSSGDRPLNGTVEFHLHDSFNPNIERVPVRFGEARLSLRAYGAFTVGAMVNDETILELDLSELPQAPEVFRNR
ncbi:TIR domain-containing protein [Luteolibacter ambystomatis]|uniref:TIR domain-containing protein n=1 Tax=Luteolibacter ambystomatis TaxID=2824561 RepID=A0A975J1K0_9BACT|nr:pYEATS domain-containing protein [Luteolibacter ambystomatis]QUE52292.1 TIR domain-containing protein [Luteolibacter ambystomatis]